jgi:uncharacterized membrane protein YozB (DUF420 family)
MRVVYTKNSLEFFVAGIFALLFAECLAHGRAMDFAAKDILYYRVLYAYRAVFAFREKKRLEALHEAE